MGTINGKQKDHAEILVEKALIRPTTPPTLQYASPFRNSLMLSHNSPKQVFQRCQTEGSSKDIYGIALMQPKILIYNSTPSPSRLCSSITLSHNSPNRVPNINGVIHAGTLAWTLLDPESVDSLYLDR